MNIFDLSFETKLYKMTNKNLPDIDLEEMEKFKEQNFRERLEFIDKYVEWIKRQPNKKWSSTQNKLISRKH